VNGLSEREVNLIGAAIELVTAARRGGDEHVTDWYDAILGRTATPAPAGLGELLDLHRKLGAGSLADGTRAASR
jgi:hypothetical protein